MSRQEELKNASQPSAQRPGETVRHMHAVSATAVAAPPVAGRPIAIGAVIGAAGALAVVAVVMSGVTEGFVSSDRFWIIASSLAAMASGTLAYLTWRDRKVVDRLDRQVEQNESQVSVLEQQVSKLEERNKLSVQLELFRCEGEINQGFLKSGLDLPVLDGYPLRQEEKREASERTILLLKQLSLLHQVFLFRDSLGKNRVDGYIEWGKRTVKPWVEEKEYTQYALQRFKAGEDIGDPEFVRGLKEIF